MGLDVAKNASLGRRGTGGVSRLDGSMYVE